MLKIAKSKVDQWRQFSKIVERHIERYAKSQYGDLPDKQIQNLTAVKIQAKLEYYVGRIGNGARGFDEEKRDALKLAHFGCYLYAYLEHGNAQADLDGEP